jgi:hypothetical protein
MLVHPASEKTPNEAAPSIHAKASPGIPENKNIVFFIKNSPHYCRVFPRGPDLSPPIKLDIIQLYIFDKEKLSYFHIKSYIFFVSVD